MPTTEQIDAVLPFLDRFEAAGFSAGSWKMPDGLMPWFDSDEVVLEFQKALYEHGWVEPFDWGEWQDAARRYVESPELVAGADLGTIRRLLTTHVRKDRFCEGHLVAMIECGHIAACLRRLRDFRLAV